MKLLVHNALLEVIKKFDISPKLIEITNSKGHGDLSTNIALKSANKFNLSPMDTANKIVKLIDRKKFSILKIEIVAPGFINFFMDQSHKCQIIAQILDLGNNFGKGNLKEYVNIEFVSANPTGHLHIGHARGAALGDSLSNIMNHAGIKVDREYYINDAGVQIKVLGITTYWRYQELFGKKINLPKDSYSGAEIIDVAKKIKTKIGDKYNNKPLTEEIENYFSNEAKLILLEVIKDHLKKFNVEIETYYSEESIYKQNLIKKFLPKLPYTYKKDGALWLKTSKFGDDKDRVLQKSDGTYTYFTPDLVYHNIKASRGYDRVINIWGADHSGYIKRMDIALQICGYPNKLQVIVVQLVKLIKNGVELKMSKRKGTTYTLIDLINEVGTDAARFLLTNRTSDSKMEFDMDIATSKSNDNPVSYVQYAYARIFQLLKKANYKRTKNPKIIDSNLKDEKIQVIIDMLWQFPELITTIAKNNKVNLLNNYVIILAKLFHSFYNDIHIINTDGQQDKLFLVDAIGQVIKIGLNLLGVKILERMPYE